MQNMEKDTSVLKKTIHAITLLLMTQMKKIFRKGNGSKNTTNWSEHTYNFYTIYPFMDNGQLLFFKW
jgi:hypothetical protein